MEHPLLRELMLAEHKFLYKLYKQKKGRNNRTTLKRASDKQIWLVLRVLFCIAAGHIPITYKNYQQLIRSKRRHTLASLKRQMEVFRKAGQKEQRRRFVLQFASVFPNLFHDIFVAPKKNKKKENVGK